LRVGTAIVPAFTRGPGVIAQTAAAMAEAAPGGFACGVGASSAVIVERWNAAAFDRPYARTRDLVRFLRQALNGDRVKEEYETFAVNGFRLARPPEPAPPVLVAALGPQMLRMAGRESDGVILNWLAPCDVPGLVDQVVAGAPAGAPSPEIVARIMVAPTEDAEAVRRLVRPLFAAYLNVPGYAAFQRNLGRAGALDAMWSAWAVGDRKGALELVPDSVVDELVVHGSPEQCRARIDEYVAAGVTTPVIAVLPFGFDVDAALTSLAPA
jgi:probable F420-dependent oxidoreductase